MSRAEEYLHRADDAERLAAKGLGLYRADMKDVAHQWRRLARQTGELDANDPRLQDPAGD